MFLGKICDIAFTIHGVSFHACAIWIKQGPKRYFGVIECAGNVNLHLCSCVQGGVDMAESDGFSDTVTKSTG